MDNLTAARAQMEISLGFHMIFAALGIGMPLLMTIAEGLWLRTGKQHYRDLAYKWGKVTAVLFAIGAVSGTALSFELGLLWPRFMQFSGSIIGPAFALEGYAFFIEAIFVGLYLYGWDRLTPRQHWLAGLPVVLSGLLSGVLVVAANAWMQVPGGFTLLDGKPVDIDALAAFKSPAWLPMAIHSSLSCYIAVGFGVAGVYAVGWLRGRHDDYHRSALKISLAVATITAFLQPLSGDINARYTAKYQPLKLAAMEALFRTQGNAPIVIGGIPDEEARELKWAIEIPSGLSLVLEGDADALITGLDSEPRSQWPNVALTHIAFQIMVASGFALMGLGCLFWFKYWRGSWEQSAVLLKLLVAAAPVGFIALEAGWVVTEAGRQPWTIYKVMRTADAVTPSGGVLTAFIGFTLLYLVLSVALIFLLKRLATGAPQPQQDVHKESPHAA